MSLSRSEVRLTVSSRAATFLRSVSEIGIRGSPTRLDNDHVYLASGEIPEKLGQVRPPLSTNRVGNVAAIGSPDNAGIRLPR